MSTIVNQRGQLYKLVTEGIQEYSSYELIKNYQTDQGVVENIPIFRFNYRVDWWLAITEDGRLYDVNRLRYLDTEITNFASIYSSHQLHCLALTENGNLFSISNNHILFLHENIKFVITTMDMKDYIFVNSNNEWFSYKGGQIPINRSLNYPRASEIVKADEGCVITNSHIYAFPNGFNRRHFPEIISINLEGSYLFSGINSNNDEDSSLTSIEIKEDGRLLTGMHSLYRCDIWNQLVEDMHQSSPWVGFIKFCGGCSLYNKDGYSYYVKEWFSLTSTEIPPHILATSTRLKNPMTKI